MLALSGTAGAKSEKAAAKTSHARLDAQAAGFSSYVLPNGFKIILVAFPAAANARIELLVKTGSKLEGYGETGMAHLLEHMLFKSAGNRIDIKSDLTNIGATWNGTTNADSTNFFETVSAEPEKIDEAIRIEADRFIRASFTKEHLHSEMSVVRNELERNDSDFNSLLMRTLERQSFSWHGYSRSTLGARSDIEGAPFSALQAFHKKHYRPDNAALIVSGNFNVQRVLALASQLFSVAKNPAAPKVGSWTREEVRALTNRSELVLPAGITAVASAWKLSGFTDPQTFAFDLAASAICDDDWGSLRRNLVLERKIAVATSCRTDIQSDYSRLIAIAGAGKEADADTISKALHDHIEAAAATGINQEQLERARLEELNALERIENSHEMLATRLAEAEVSGDWRLYFLHRDIIKTLTLDEANAALKKWAVGVNRSDVLLRHADGIVAPEVLEPINVKTQLAGKLWPAIRKNADRLPSSARELAKSTVNISLDGSRARAALISRQTQGDMAWLVFGNDYGNESALAGRQISCAIGDDLMAYGGAGFSRDQISAKLEVLQAKWSLGLGGIALEAPRKNIDAALDILLTAWTSPVLPESEFDRIKTDRIVSLEAALKDPAMVAAAAAGLRFDNYPSHHLLQPRSLEQQLSETQAVGFADATTCVADLLGVAHVRLAMVGAFSPQDVQNAWSKIGKLPSAKIAYERIKDIEAPLAIDTSPVVVAMPEKPSAAISGMTLLRIDTSSSEFPALRIAVEILGGNGNSRIWKRLREREGLAYSAGVDLLGNDFEQRSSLSIYASAASDMADSALTKLKEELALAINEGFSEKEVEREKQVWLQARQLHLRSEKTFAGNLAKGLYSGRDYAKLAQYDERISHLTAREVNGVLRKYLADAPIVWATGRGR